MKHILFINACVRKESRTLVFARDILRQQGDDVEVTEIVLQEEGLLPLTQESLAKREALIQDRKWEDPMLRYAKQFAKAEKIVVAAPFWDLSFPALLKIYLEHIAVAGITFEYRKGRPYGLCQAKELIYITTSGGPIVEDFGYAYVKALAKNFYGIEETVSYRLMNMDVDMVTAENVLQQAKPSVIR